MTLLSHASNHTDQADMAIMTMVETIRDQEQPTTASAVASMIGGAPVGAVSFRLSMLTGMGLLEHGPAHPGMADTFRVTEMGAELLRRDMIGWSPSPREEKRRARQLQAAREGLWRSRLR